MPGAWPTSVPWKAPRRLRNGLPWRTPGSSLAKSTRARFARSTQSSLRSSSAKSTSEPTRSSSQQPLAKSSLADGPPRVLPRSREHSHSVWPLHYRHYLVSLGKRSPTSHFSWVQSRSKVLRATFWSPISIRLSEDLEIPRRRANRYCGVSPRSSRSLFASRFDRFPICGKDHEWVSFPHVGNFGKGVELEYPRTQLHQRHG